MYVHPPTRLCFLAHPRAASRSVRDALKKQHEFLRKGDHHGGPPAIPVSGLKPFCVVRNHWDALVSWWFTRSERDRRPRGRDHRNERTDIITVPWLEWWTKGNANYFSEKRLWWFLDYTSLRLEYNRLEPELNELLAMYELAPVKLETIGATHHGHYSRYYDEDSMQWIADRWGTEIAQLGYTFEREDT